MEDDFWGSLMMIEAGGNDYMLMRILVTHMGLEQAPTLIRGREDFPFLPIDGTSPW